MQPVPGYRDRQIAAPLDGFDKSDVEMLAKTI
jgi:hypothetical protein